MDSNIFGKIVVPVASPDDAETTCGSIIEHIEDKIGHVVFIYIIEKAGGAPDKASVEQREEYANEIYETVSTTLAGAGLSFEFEVLFGTDIVETVREAADDTDATAIVFTPRGTSRWVRLLTGDIAYSLTTEGDRPIVSLPPKKEGDSS